ncbi:MAG TPA: CRISPR-associated protein Cas5 [Lentisphaeria bacterium]|nr:MAG: hypothetical protein A2X47_04905 [Lentisphaerae bacterium GWF2_38_69]HBM16332.1 CRISPR-associated protein Cas5 [Lentisphaeria bacterium]
MINKVYEVSFEVEGVMAMFTRPDAGAAFVSYPCPTYSAAKGMFEAVSRVKSAFIKPTKVEICSPIQYTNYVTNYGGPLRKSNQLAQGSSYQLVATVLSNVCYKIYGIIEEVGLPDMNKVITTNHLHLLQDKFETRLRNDRFYYMPCLGWKEFTPSYFGTVRAETKANESINEFIPSMLYSPFDKNVSGNSNAVYKQNIWIKKGVMEYA